MDEAQYLALSAAQRKALQQQWQAQGLYRGPIDGKSGDGMRAAFAAAQAARGNEAQVGLRNKELELQATQLAAAKEERDLAERRRIENESKGKAREAAADPWMDTFVPFATGAGVGGVYGELTNRGLNKFEEGNARALREISDELGPTRNLTGSQLNRSRARGAARAAERFAPTNPVMKGLSGVGRLASYGIPAGVVYNEYRNYQGRAQDEKLTETERKANQQIANGLLGVTTGIGVEGGRRFFFPSREAGVGKAEMRVHAAREFADRMDADAVAKGPTKAALTAQAEAAGVAVKSRMTKAQIEAAIAGVKQIGSKLPAVAAPLAAAGLAYGMTPGSADAADGSVDPNAGDNALANAGVAGGTAAGAGYGLNKLARAAPGAARLLGPGLNALAGGVAAYDNASEAQGYRNAMPPEQRDTMVGQLLPHAMPLAMRGARDIASIAGAPGRLQDAAMSALTPGNATPQDYQGSVYPEAAPPNALAAAGQQEDAFGRALKEFMAFVQEQQGGQEGAPQ